MQRWGRLIPPPENGDQTYIDLYQIFADGTLSSQPERSIFGPYDEQGFGPDGCQWDEGLQAWVEIFAPSPFEVLPE